MEMKISKSKLVIFMKNKIQLIPLNDIMFIEHFSQKIYINLANEIEYSFRYSLKKLEDILPEEFKRTHRSFIVNTNFITELKVINETTYEAVFSSEKQALVSREYIHKIF